MFSTNEEKKLDWMYKGPGGSVDREEYLLGRSIDKSLEQANEAEKRGYVPKPKNHVEHDCVPPSIRDIKNLQISEEQVDLQTKLQEDPLILIKKKEEEARRMLLQNPVQLKKIQKVLKEKTHKGKKKKKKRKKSDSDSDILVLDKKLTETYNKLKKKMAKQEDKLDKLLAKKFLAILDHLSEDQIDYLHNVQSSDSSSDGSYDSDSGNRSKSKKKKLVKKTDKSRLKDDNKKSKKKRHDSSSSDSDDSEQEDRNHKRSTHKKDKKKDTRVRHRSSDDDRSRSKKKSKSNSTKTLPKHKSRRDESSDTTSSNSEIERRRKTTKNNPHTKKENYRKSHTSDVETRKGVPKTKREEKRQRKHTSSDESDTHQRPSKTDISSRNKSRNTDNYRHKDAKRDSGSENVHKKVSNQNKNDKLYYSSRRDDRNKKIDMPPSTSHKHKVDEVVKHQKPTDNNNSSNKSLTPKKKRKVSSSSSTSSSSSSTSSTSSSSDNDDDDLRKQKTLKQNFGLVKADGTKIIQDKSKYQKDTRKRESAKEPVKPQEKPKRLKLSEEEIEKRRKEMLQNAQWRDKDREQNVKRHREELKRENLNQDYKPEFIQKELMKSANNSTVESRIKSNINNIQRSGRDMQTHFSRRY